MNEPTICRPRQILPSSIQRIGVRLRALRFVNLVNVGTVIALIGSFVVRFYWSLFTVFRRYDDTLVYLIRLIFLAAVGLYVASLQNNILCVLLHRALITISNLEISLGLIPYVDDDCV